MTRPWMILGTILSVALVVGACAPAENGEPEPPLEEPAPERDLAIAELRPAKRPEVRHVLLRYSPKDEEKDCKITVYDDAASIWMKQHPRVVEWQVFEAATDEHQWEIEYKAGQGEFQQRRFLIPCKGHKAYRSGFPKTAGTWTYKVTVWDCLGGQPHGDPVCDKDPDIMIKDG